MADNISKFENCYGCGVCVKSCPVNIISMEENEDGFYSPIIHEPDKCIECGICLKVCAFNHTEIATSPSPCLSGAIWSKDDNIRLKCSSGGVGFEIGRRLLENGYQDIGVRYNSDKKRAEHYVSLSIDEFVRSMGSKYIPSDTSIFGEINLKKKYMVSGTPCQIDSFRRLIRQFHVEDNFVLIDFFCHGVPSLLLWDKYLSEVESKIGSTGTISWRNKLTGWHDSWVMSVEKKNTETTIGANGSELAMSSKAHPYMSAFSKGDLFYELFLGNYCLNKCCYSSCKYKLTSSSADIRIGDFWGDTYASDDKGVSSVIAFTEKGKKLLDELNDKCCFENHAVEICCEGQMPKAPKRPAIRSIVPGLLRSPLPLKATLFCCKLSIIHKRISNRLKRWTTRK